MIMAENDYVLPPSAADAMHKHCAKLEKHLIRNCGHWTQQEHPEEVNRVLVGWLQRTFG
jgi:microsomal epoxide hydrolase/non-specific protein-tyrosine kinase